MRYRVALTSTGELSVHNWKNVVLNVVTGGATLLGSYAVWTRVSRPATRPPVLAKPTAVSDWREYARVGTRVGSSSAPVTITIFSDYQCPFCRAFATDVAALRAKWPSEVAVVYRQFPMSFHQFARPAAYAALCAGAQRRYQEYDARLFAVQDSLGQKSWEDIGRESGVPDLRALTDCMKSQNTQRIVVRDSSDGRKLGVHGTPTFLLNGLRFEGSPGQDTLEAYIRKELKKAT
jgi:protein-disulfide isomerase